MVTTKNSKTLLGCLVAIGGIGCLGVLAILGMFLIVGPGFLISWSHIAANVPSSEEFDAILARDLRSYFEELGGRTVTVEYEFLRKGPTQVGVAYPKYYLWVKVYSDGVLVEEGAVRIAVIEKKRVEVTDYLSKEEILSNPEQIYYIFPKPVCGKILERAKR